MNQRKLYGVQFILVDGSKETLSIKMLDKRALFSWLENYLKENHALNSVLKAYKITEEIIK